MRAPQRSPGSRPARGVARWLALGLLGSALIHGAVVAALILWPAQDPFEEPGEAGTVALVFADTMAEAGGAMPESGDPAEPAEAPAPPVPAIPPAPPVPPSAPQVAAPPPVPPAAPPPMPPAPPEAPRDFAALPSAPTGELPAPAEPAETPPAPEAPRDAPDETLPEPPPPPPQAQPAPEPPPAQPPARPSPPRQASQPRQQQAARQSQAPPRPDPGAGGSTQEGSLGSFALGAVAPPSVDPGIRNNPPDYPADSRRRGEEGVVRLSLNIGVDGQVMGAEVSTTSGYPDLDRAALDAARRWRFRPASRGGLPVAATLTTAVHFRLQDGRRR